MKNWSHITLVVITVVLLTLNIFLINQNNQLKQAVQRSKLLITDEGYKFSGLKIKGWDGNEENIDFSDSSPKTLLLVFNTSCEYCVQEYSHWKELVGNLDKDHWRVFAVTSEDDLDKIKKHAEEHKIDNVKFGSISGEDMGRARMRYTPMTLAVSETGEVEKVWPGLWTKNFELPD